MIVPSTPVPVRASLARARPRPCQHTKGTDVYTRTTIRWMAGGVLAAAVACAAGVAAAAGTTTVPGNVAGWVKTATKKGPAAGNVEATIAVHMALRNSAGLKKFATEVSSPKSALYGRYLTNEQFAAAYAPAAADVDAVKALLEHAGMANVTVGPHGVYVSAKATVAQLEKTFGVDQNVY